MPDSSFSELEGVRSILAGGLDERIVPESININDFSRLVGLRQDQLGELVRYPGEVKIVIDKFPSAIKGLFSLGEYVLIQTNSVLLRVRLNELFSDFPQVVPELFPDSYAPPGPTPPPINPELMSYALLNYQLSSGVAPSTTLANAWNNIPLNVEVSDSDNRVSVAAGVITITAGSYPAFVRIDAEVCVTGPQSIAPGANSSQRAALRLINNATAAVVANGSNLRITTANAAGEGRPVGNCRIKGRFQIAASTDFRLQMFTTEATSFGRELTTGQPEVYAQCEILIEE